MKNDWLLVRLLLHHCSSSRTGEIPLGEFPADDEEAGGADEEEKTTFFDDEEAEMLMAAMKKPDGVLVATFDGYGLFRTNIGGAWENWRLFKLGETKKPKRGSRQKFSFWLAFDGSRLANSHDTEALQKHFPEMAEWATSVMRANYETV